MYSMNASVTFAITKVAIRRLLLICNQSFEYDDDGGGGGSADGMMMTTRNDAPFMISKGFKKVFLHSVLRQARQ